MKTVKSAITALVCGLLLASTACKKKEVNLGTPPTINLKTGNGYLANNDTVNAGDTVIMGVTASANYAPDKHHYADRWRKEPGKGRQRESDGYSRNGGPVAGRLIYINSFPDTVVTLQHADKRSAGYHTTGFLR